jgi:transcriptional antiterminator RfaH
MGLEFILRGQSLKMDNQPRTPIGFTPGGSSVAEAELRTMPFPSRAASATLRWYVVQCLSHREMAAAAQLRNQGFAVFLPRRRKTRRHARRIETVLVPFFPGYLFVALDMECDPWRSVNGTYGVAGLVMHGDLPAPVPEGVVEGLQQSSDEDGMMCWLGDVRLGEPVRILEGAFTDFIGQLDQLGAVGRVRVLLNIMGGRVPILLPRESVASVDSVL